MGLRGFWKLQNNVNPMGRIMRPFLSDLKAIFHQRNVNTFAHR